MKLTTRVNIVLKNITSSWMIDGFLNEPLRGELCDFIPIVFFLIWLITSYFLNIGDVVYR